jgi:hypothetical protein
MKINFKKLAMSAGVTAAMAAGSMSAHAVITAVPAPAQLVPLFYYSTAAGNSWDTDVRITVPKAVGADSVIALLAGQRNGIDNIALDTSWGTATGAFQPTVVNGDTILANEIHWYWLDNTSREIQNGTFIVTPDDTVWLSAHAVADAVGGASSGQAGYLILGNASADNGGAPQFSFAADAWVENENTNGYPDAFSIPVLGLEDDVDATSYPTPTNNLIQVYPASAGGPVASPIQTGIRTSSTFAPFKYRVVDLPIHNTTFWNNTVVAWTDRNGAAGNGLSGRLYGIGPDEEYSSLGPVSMPNQLNIVTLGWNPGSEPGTTTLGMLNTCSKTCGARAASAQVATLNNLGEAGGHEPGRRHPPAGGFLKFVIDEVALPTPAAGASLADGAYSAMIMFNVPGLSDIGIGKGADEEAPNLAIDTGFFTQN